MNKVWLGIVAASMCLTSMTAQGVTINLAAGVLRNQAGNPLPDGSLVMLVSAGPNGTFGNVTDTAFSDDPDDIIIPADPYGGTFEMDSSTAILDPNSGIHVQSIQFNLGNLGLASGQKLRLVWFVGIGLGATSPGPGRYYGVYTDPVGIDYSEPWVVPNSNAATIDFNLLTIANGGSVDEDATRASNRTPGSSNLPPSAVCQSVTVSVTETCEADVTADDVNNGSSDPDGEIVSKTLTPAGPYAAGTHVVTLTVTDDEGATATCTATITVQDMDVPVVVCPNDVDVTVTEPATERSVTFTSPSATDNCPDVDVDCSPSSGSIFQVGTTTVTCTATDAAGLSATCTFDVNVTQVQNQSPVAVCRDVVVAANSSCQAVVTASQVDNGSTDPDGEIVSRVLSPVGPYELGTTTVVFTVMDNAGATSSCLATVTVQDQTAPVLGACPANIRQTVPNGQLLTMVEYNAPTATDNCVEAIVNCDPPSGSEFELGTTTVTCTASDGQENISTCTFTVTLTELIGECRSIRELRNTINELELGRKAKERLTDPLTKAMAAKRQGKLSETRNQLRAFINVVRDLTDKGRLDEGLAENLITCARIQIQLTRLDATMPLVGGDPASDADKKIEQKPLSVTF